MKKHNPLTVSDILLKNVTARLKEFYPLTKVQTATDKQKLVSMSYNPGYTVSEWPYPIPVDKIYYSRRLPVVIAFNALCEKYKPVMYISHRGLKFLISSAVHTETTLFRKIGKAGG